VNIKLELLWPNGPPISPTLMHDAYLHYITKLMNVQVLRNTTQQFMKSSGYQLLATEIQTDARTD